MRTANIDSPRGQCIAFTCYTAELVQAIVQANRDDEPVSHLEKQLDFAATGLAEALTDLMENKRSYRERDA
jgi:hypothetical protein